MQSWHSEPLTALLLGVENSPALTASFSIAMSFLFARLPDQLLFAGLSRLLELVGEVHHGREELGVPVPPTTEEAEFDLFGPGPASTAPASSSMPVENPFQSPQQATAKASPAHWLYPKNHLESSIVSSKPSDPRRPPTLRSPNLSGSTTHDTWRILGILRGSDFQLQGSESEKLRDLHNQA